MGRAYRIFGLTAALGILIFVLGGCGGGYSPTLPSPDRTPGTLVTGFPLTGSVGNPISWGVTAYLPWMVDFSGVSVRDRDGNSVGGLRLSGGFKADPRYPATMSWSTTP